MQLLVQKYNHWCSCWYKSTNTDAAAGTKVQMLTQSYSSSLRIPWKCLAFPSPLIATRHRYSLYWLYWYKRTCFISTRIPWKCLAFPSPFIATRHSFTDLNGTKVLALLVQEFLKRPCLPISVNRNEMQVLSLLVWLVQTHKYWHRRRRNCCTKPILKSTNTLDY